MNRSDSLKRIATGDQWDILIVGGGASGLGAAVDAASRGYRTLLLEQSDFAKGTSSRSTKLVHGGVRYLKQGNVGLVLEALQERGRLRRNAPHLVHNLEFVVPVYDWWEGPFYGVGLRLYDMLAGRLGLGDSRNLSRDETLQSIPTLEPDQLRGGVLYYDAQFDDARLAITLARTATNLGATLLNYARVTSVTKRDSLVSGVQALDEETGDLLDISAKVVINATGVFTDNIRRMDDPEIQRMVRVSQGVHIVLDRSFLPGETAIMVPSTEDGRVLFAIPWHNKVVVGTTDTPVDSASLEPKPLEQEIEFLLKTAAQYLTKNPSPSDIQSAFAGLRPLVAPPDEQDTASISREHVVSISRSGLVTIAGGKWTTYRQMAQDTIDQAAAIGQLPFTDSKTRSLRLHGSPENEAESDQNDIDHLSVYGTDTEAINSLIAERAELGELIAEGLPYSAAEVVWAARYEMARTVEDVLARRTRCLFLNAGSSITAAPKVAKILSDELGRDRHWQESQVTNYEKVARRYLA
ncbi:MAG: glycerol-3-phosphate dehydrogenase/oxidase [Rhodothermales bacterium]|nr:glycerol-3-phosphate dehydrogenase/oxidase [Rhodothermales bacterium]